jgi:hypothetical protein
MTNPDLNRIALDLLKHPEMQAALKLLHAAPGPKMWIIPRDLVPEPDRWHFQVGVKIYGEDAILADVPHVIVGRMVDSKATRDLDIETIRRYIAGGTDSGFSDALAALDRLKETNQ